MRLRLQLEMFLQQQNAILSILSDVLRKVDALEQASVSSGQSLDSQCKQCGVSLCKEDQLAGNGYCEICSRRDSEDVSQGNSCLEICNRWELD